MRRRGRVKYRLSRLFEDRCKNTMDSIRVVTFWRNINNVLVVMHANDVNHK